MREWEWGWVRDLERKSSRHCWPAVHLGHCLFADESVVVEDSKAGIPFRIGCPIGNKERTTTVKKIVQTRNIRLCVNHPMHLIVLQWIKCRTWTARWAAMNPVLHVYVHVWGWVYVWESEEIVSERVSRGRITTMAAYKYNSCTSTSHKKTNKKKDRQCRAWARVGGWGRVCLPCLCISKRKND